MQSSNIFRGVGVQKPVDEPRILPNSDYHRNRYVDYEDMPTLPNSLFS